MRGNRTNRHAALKLRDEQYHVRFHSGVGDATRAVARDP